MTINKVSVTTTPPRRNWTQILAIMIGALAPLTTGLLYAWSSPSILQIQTNNQTYGISEEETSYFPILPPIGMIVGALFFNRLTDLLGRKGTLLLVAIPHLACWLIIYFATTAPAFYVSRIMAGIADAALYASMPIYVGEIATPQVRGFWGNFNSFTHYGGQFCITVLGSYLSIQSTALTCISLPIIFVILFSLMPESPYHLIQKGRFDKAYKALQWLRREDDVQLEYHAMKLDVERQTSESGTWWDLVAVRSNRRAIIAGIFLRFTQQGGGISAFATNTQPIFEKASQNYSPQISSIIFLGLCFGLNFFGSAIVAKFGRRKSYVYSSLGCGVVLLGLTVYFTLDNFNLINIRDYGWMPLAGMVLYIISFSLGMGVVPTLMLSELFSASIKGKGLCLMNMAFGVALFVGNYSFKLLYKLLGLYAPFCFFAAICFGAAVCTPYFVPETKGKTLEEIQQSLKAKKFKMMQKVPA